MSAKKFSLKEMLLTEPLALNTHDIFTPFRADPARTVSPWCAARNARPCSRMYPADCNTAGDNAGTISDSESCFRELRADRGHHRD
jgi:hypothetical protein